MTEQWLPVLDYDGLYAVSAHGRVRSVRNGRTMKPVLTYDGYHTVNLYKAGRATRHRISRLVARAFSPGGENALHCHVAHLDGDKTNNVASNLKWVSRTENESHKSRHGRVAYGERNGRSKLTAEQVAELRSRYVSGVPGPALARDYGICPQQAWRIATGGAWRSDESGGSRSEIAQNPTKSVVYGRTA